MKAVFKAPATEANIRPYRKEKRGFYKQISVFSGQKEVVTVRFYLTGETVCCCVWVNFPHPGYLGEYPEQHPVGGGKCNTMNADRESTAFENACAMSGYTFSERITGAGMRYCDKGMEALLSIPAKLGFSDVWAHEAHA